MMDHPSKRDCGTRTSSVAYPWEQAQAGDVEIIRSARDGIVSRNAARLLVSRELETT